MDMAGSFWAACFYVHRRVGKIAARGSTRLAPASTRQKDMPPTRLHRRVRKTAARCSTRLAQRAGCKKALSLARLQVRKNGLLHLGAYLIYRKVNCIHAN
jgi:hypothetical protein